jgi:hypothetical protein
MFFEPLLFISAVSSTSATPPLMVFSPTTYDLDASAVVGVITNNPKHVATRAVVGVLINNCMT